MLKLISANLYRLRRSKTFYILGWLIFLIGIYSYINTNGFEPLACVDCPNQLGSVIFMHNYVGFLFLPIFLGFFFNAFYRHGTVKNQIITGHFRPNIYLANLLTSILVNIIFSFFYLSGVLLIYLILGGTGIASTWQDVIWFFFLSLLVILFISSVYTFVTMTFASTLGSSLVNFITIVWQMRSIDLVSIDYRSTYGLYKYFYDFILNITPMGEVYKISSLEDSLHTLPIVSIMLSIFLTTYGIILFRKKQIN